MKFPNLLKGFLLLLTVAVFSTLNAGAQCTPAYGSFGCSFGDDINSFMLTGASSTSISDPSTGCSTGNYDDRTTAVPAVTLFQGGTYSGIINVSGLLGSPFSVDGMQVYIDFNNNSTFESTESVGGVNAIVSTPATTSFSITIPGTAATGSHRMRVVLCSDGDATYPGIDPCAESHPFPLPFPGIPYSIGEAHDYLVTVTAASTPCAPVTGLTVTGITASSATLNWTAVTGAIGYEWAVNTSSTPPASGTPTTLTTASPSGLSASTAYYAHVRTKCSATSFSTWVTIPFTTTGSTSTCAPVTGLTVSGITTSGASLNWTAVTGASGYEWAVNTSATPPASGTATTLTTASASGLTSATAYYAHVRTQCGTIYSTWVSVPFSTLSSSCPPVSGLTASAITLTSATVSWTAVTSGSMGYQYVIDNIVTDPTGSGTNTTATSTSPTGLTSATTYYAHVRDSCGVGSFSVWTTIPFTTLSSSCNAVTGLTATGITSSGATLNWTMASGAVASTYVVDVLPADPVISGVATTTSTAAISGLSGSTTYYAHVRDTCGPTALSAWVTIPLTTLAGTGGVHNATGTGYFGISAYPNPVKDVLTVVVDGAISGKARLVVTDITGKLLRSIAIDTASSSVDLAGLPTGVYLVRYIDAEHAMTIKCSKE
jgi:hypothetical protein